MRYPQAQPRTAPPTRVDGSDVTMDREVPHSGTTMAVPINFRLMRSSVDTDASIRNPMRRAADHRSGNKGISDGWTQSALWHECPLALAASMFVTCIRAPHPGAAPSFITRRTRLRVAWDGPGRRCLVPNSRFPSRVMDCFTSVATLRFWVPVDYVARLNPRAHTGAYSLAS